MQRTIEEYIQLCEWDPARFLILSENVFDPLIYYSHLVPLIVSLAIGLLVFLKSPKLLAARWLFISTFFISLWLFFDLILWATEKPTYTMFFWSVVNLIEPMIYAGMLFFVYAFIDGKSISFKHKLVVFGLLLPTAVLASTNLNLSYYDLTNCWREAVEGPLVYYNYIIEAVLALWIVVFGIHRFKEKPNAYERTKILLITIASAFFLLSLSIGNIIGSINVEWDNAGQYGLFGIPIFGAALAYLIVKYHAFNIKLLATQMLIAALGLLTFALLFVEDISLIRLVVYITLIFFTILGYLLIRSVKREVEQRERIEKLAKDLKTANEGQQNLIHIINHQIKGYLSKARNIFSELLHEPDYGPVSEASKPMLAEGFKSLTEGVDFVKDFLDASNIEKGSYAFSLAPIDFRALVEEMAEKQKSLAEDRKLSYEVKVDEGDYTFNGDKLQLGQAVKNLIDNSIRYTLEGGLSVNLSKKDNKILFSVKDTGVGLSEELKPKLFTQGGRDKNSIKININSTGFGLSFVKGVAEGHQGRVWAESEGPNKGSTFYLELPVS